MSIKSLGQETYQRATRTLEIHQNKEGWYFTVHQGDTFLFQSKEVEDRTVATTQGIGYLDFLNQQDYEIAVSQKGKTNGQ
jgi:hypothetical protein